MNPPADTGDDRAESPLQIPFSGFVDAVVIDDLHSLCRTRMLVLERLMLVCGVIGLPVGAWLAMSAYQAGDVAVVGDALVMILSATIMVAAFFELRKGWARRLTGQEISGGVHSVGVVVEQLDDRAAWSEFRSAWVGETAALLFTGDAPRVPRVLSFDGLPLHRSFFESEETWMRARQLIRERITDVRTIGL